MTTNALATASIRPHLSARQSGQLFCDDVIVFQFIPQGFGIFKPHHHAKYFSAQRQKAFNQGFSSLGANVGLVPFIVLHDVFVFQAPHLFVCEIHADCFLAYARRNQNRKLLGESRNFGAGRRRRQTCRLAFLEVHDLSHHGVVFLRHYFHSYILSIDRKKKHFSFLEFAIFFTAQIQLVSKNVCIHLFCKFEHRIFIALFRGLRAFIFYEPCF